MSKHARARRYLQASMESGYTGLPEDVKQAKQDLMRAHERAYPGVRNHALAGADRDFDEPLSPGEREHQQHLRRQEGLTHGQVLNMRRALRGHQQTSAKASRGRRVVRTLSHQTGVAPAAGDAGSLALKAIGAIFGLAIAYLLLNEKGQGPKAFAGLLGAITGVLHIAIGPVDPLGKNTMQILGASSSNQSQAASSSSGSERSLSRAIGGPIGSSTMRRRLNPAFGPAPGIRTPLTALGG